MPALRKTVIVLVFFSAAAIAAFLGILPRWASDSPRFNAELLYRCALKCKNSVVQGRDGWLFYRNSFLSIVLPWPSGNAGRIASFRDSLAARGVELVVVPAPNKELVYPEKAAHAVPEEGCRQRAALITNLRTANVHVVDLLPLFLARKGQGDTLFDSLDTHGNDRAIVLAAQAIADTMRKVLPSLPDTQRFITRDTIEQRCSDMVRLRIRSEDCDKTYPLRRTSVRNPDGTAYEDDPGSPVLIFGDSNVNMGSAESAELGAHLARLTGKRTLTMSRIKAANCAPGLFLTDKKVFLKRLKVFIWVFASRSLAEPIK